MIIIHNELIIVISFLQSKGIPLDCKNQGIPLVFF